jgi:hypothetical protein
MDHRPGDDEMVTATQEYLSEVFMRTVADTAGNIGSVRSGFYCDSAPKTVLDEANERFEQRIKNQWRPAKKTPSGVLDGDRPLGAILDEADARFLERMKRQQGK